VIIVGLVLMLVFVVMRVGGPVEAIALARASAGMEFSVASPDPWYVTLEAWAIPVIGSLVAAEVLSRVMAARTGEIARRSGIGAGVLYLVIGCIPILIALLAGEVVGAVADSEQVLPAVAREILPTLLFAIFAGGLISAILSTVDSTLLVASGLLSHNQIIPAIGITSERTKVRVARAGVVAFGIIAYVLAVTADGVMALVEQASSLGSAGIAVTVCFALYSTLGSARTAAATLVAGLVVYVGAVIGGSSVPFLASLGAALTTWGIGCATDYAAS
jgi:Na+/proline symporter